MKNTVLFTMLLLAFVACKSKKKVAVDTPAAQQTSQTTQTPNVSALPDSIYRFTVSFISIGAGTDRNAKEKFNQFILQFNEKNKVNIIAETANWGREGETDYCLKLNELSKQQQDQFITETKELLKSSTLVRYTENSMCKHKKAKG